MEENYKYYFHSPISFKKGDIAAFNIGSSNNSVYKEVIIDGDPYIAPSGAQYIDVTLVYTKEKLKVPTFDLIDINTIKITNRADIYFDNKNKLDYSRFGKYILVNEIGNILLEKTCSNRKEANKFLLNEEILNKNKITHVYSKGELIWKN